MVNTQNSENRTAGLKATQQIAMAADRLRDLAASGLLYAENVYEMSRYQAVQEIAAELLLLVSQGIPEHLAFLEPLILSHPTPLVTGDAAIIDQQSRILLIQRADNHCWAMREVL